jgi:hypothetical protein
VVKVTNVPENVLVETLGRLPELRVLDVRQG